MTKLAQFSLLASGWLCVIMPAFSDKERNARFEDGGIGGPDRGGGGRDDRPSHGAPPPPDIPPLLPEASRTTHGRVLNENFIINEFKCDKRKMRTVPAMGRREILVVAKMVGIVEGTEIQELS